MAIWDRLGTAFARSEPQRYSLVTDKRALAIAGACAIVVPITASFEGLRTKPYNDVTGHKTVCYGDTEVPMRVYTADECGQLLRKRLARDYAPKLIECVPAFADPRRKYAYAALLDFSYNAGWGAACKSRMAKAFNQGKWVQGCYGFVNYFVTSKGVRLRGLERRRIAEKDLCLKDLS